MSFEHDAPISSSYFSPVMLDDNMQHFKEYNSASKKLSEKLTADAKRQKYIRRIFHFHQMDFEYALWQMLYLFVAPQKVYRNFAYRKQTKDHWSRDDPAFLVLVGLSLLVSSIRFAAVLKLGIIGFFKFFAWVIVIDFMCVGIVLASTFWYLTNHYLIVQPPRGQDVEWGYCFDVHLNAFFPLLMILHFFQLPFLEIFINHEWFSSRLVGNLLWLIAVGYYIYMTFLGYSSLPFLKNTHRILYPLTILVFGYFLTVLLGLNLTWNLCSFYMYRIF